MLTKRSYAYRICSVELLGLLGTVESALSTLHDGLDLHSVAGVGDEVRKLLAHADLGQVEGTVEVVPELGLEVLSGGEAEGNVVHANGRHDAIGSSEIIGAGNVGSEASLGVDEVGDGEVSARGTEESLSGSSILRRDGAISNGGLDLLLEGVLSEVAPESLEVRLGRNLGAHLVRVLEVLLSDDLGSKSVQIIPDGLVLVAALLGRGVNAEVDVGGLVSMSERVQFSLHVIDLVLVTEPVDGGLLVEEVSRAQALTPLLESEPLDNVGLNTLTAELVRSGLLVEVIEGVLPGSAGVRIHLPAASLLGGGPVGHSEALEESAGLSVEGNISNTLGKGTGMEVLSVHMVHVVRLLVELVHVEVLDANTYKSIYN